MSGSNFVLTCHHCGMIGYIRPQCHKLKREQNYIARSLPKKPIRPKHIICHHCGAFSHLRPLCSKFHALKRIKRKEKLELLGSYAKKGKPVLSENSMLLKKVFNALNSLSMCISNSHSSTLVSLFMRHSFQTIVLFGWGKVPMVELLLFWSLI